MVSGIPGALDFGAILLKAPVYKGFLRFRTRFGPPFLGDFSLVSAPEFPGRTFGKSAAKMKWR
jgi:hypothetical protein